MAQLIFFTPQSNNKIVLKLSLASTIQSTKHICRIIIRISTSHVHTLDS